MTSDHVIKKLTSEDFWVIYGGDYGYEDALIWNFLLDANVEFNQIEDTAGLYKNLMDLVTNDDENWDLTLSKYMHKGKIIYQLYNLNNENKVNLTDWFFREVNNY